RRHTRFSRDWSSDVCSSDLVVFPYKHPVNNRNCHKSGKSQSNIGNDFTALIPDLFLKNKFISRPARKPENIFKKQSGADDNFGQKKQKKQCHNMHTFGSLSFGSIKTFKIKNQTCNNDDKQQQVCANSGFSLRKSVNNMAGINFAQNN